jgi:tetratricopeptide (TPR) repeat protein
VNDSPTYKHDLSLAGRRVVLVGKLASMSRREAEQLIGAQGGQVVGWPDESADTIVVGDDVTDTARLTANPQLFDDAAREAVGAGRIELVRESELWARLGLVDSGQGIRRLYTPAMLAELVRVPISAIRHWHRRSALQAAREVGRLPYFDFTEVRVARKLAQLLAAGCSLATVNRRLDDLARSLPDLPRPLADPSVVVEGRHVFIRRGENMAMPSGQMVIDFAAADSEAGDDSELGSPVAIPFAAADALCKSTKSAQRGGHPFVAEDLRSVAAELESEGRDEQAIDVYRAILVSGQSTPDDHFALAELLYRGGDLSAARERYYVAIELDEDFVEARSNLGCILAEQGDLELAEAAFRGALEFHPDYADAHYHLARLLDRAHRAAEAARHWQLFMNLAPASPWADEARDRIGGGDIGVGCQVSDNLTPDT